MLCRRLCPGCVLSSEAIGGACEATSTLVILSQRASRFALSITRKSIINRRSGCCREETSSWYHGTGRMMEEEMAQSLGLACKRHRGSGDSPSRQHHSLRAAVLSSTSECACTAKSDGTGRTIPGAAAGLTSAFRVRVSHKASAGGLDPLPDVRRSTNTILYGPRPAPLGVRSRPSQALLHVWITPRYKLSSDVSLVHRKYLARLSSCPFRAPASDQSLVVLLHRPHVNNIFSSAKHVHSHQQPHGQLA